METKRDDAPQSTQPITEAPMPPDVRASRGLP